MALLATRENGRDRNGSNDPTELRGIAAPAGLDRRRETPKADLGLQRVESELARRAELSDSDLVWRSSIPTDDSKATDAPLRLGWASVSQALRLPPINSWLCHSAAAQSHSRVRRLRSDPLHLTPNH
jgi:hypothetical protein